MCNRIVRPFPADAPQPGPILTALTWWSSKGESSRGISPPQELSSATLPVQATQVVGLSNRKGKPMLETAEVRVVPTWATVARAVTRLMDFPNSPSVIANRWARS